MTYEKQPGVPRFEAQEYGAKSKDFVLLIPIINEGNRIHQELRRAQEHHVADHVDIVICDGGSQDGSTAEEALKALDVNTLLVKQDEGKQGAQLRMGIWWAMQRGYQGVITIDGNNKDSIEDSRFVPGGVAINTPLLRTISVKLIHAPLISLAAGFRFTDTTNAYRAYSMEYLTDERVQPLRDVFRTYELLAYLSVRATQLGMRACEIPVTRAYPKTGKTPTKISFFKGNWNLMEILLKTLFGAYNPK